MAKLYLDLQVAMVNVATGLISGPGWLRFFQDLVSKVNTLESTVTATLGVNIKTVAQLNALGLASSDAGYIARVETYDHLVRWTGTAWEWLDGDRPGKIEDWTLNPGDGYALCDGSVTTLLTVGATLTETSFTTPNLTGAATLRKSAGSYSGTVDAAVAPGISGATASTAPSVSGNTGNAGAHDHGAATGSAGTGATSHRHGSIQVDDNNDGFRQTVMNFADPDAAHTHSITAAADHAHAVALTVDGHTHGVGTLAVDATAMPRSVGLMPYVRR